MRLKGLQIEAVRNLQNVAIEPSSGINLLEGGNGAGKTSVLEAISLLSSGVSFRTRKPHELISHSEQCAWAIARLDDDGVGHRIGVQYSRDGKHQHRVDAEAVSRRSDLSRLLPTLVITPDHFQLVAGGPGERRRYLDWGLFHVEHTFHPAWRHYRKALSQRNACLRSGQDLAGLPSWNMELARWGEQIDTVRGEYVSQLESVLNSVLSQLESFPEIKLRYRRGWTEQFSLLEALERERIRPGPLAKTQHGPHVADIDLMSHDSLAKHYLSRGQQKLLVYAMKLAQLAIYRSSARRQCLVLCDDLPAELDGDRRRQVVRLLRETGCQVFVTAAITNSIESPDSVFHVEHGGVTQVL